MVGASVEALALKRNSLGLAPIAVLSISFSGLATFLNYVQGALFRQSPASWLVAPSPLFGAPFLALFSFFVFPVITLLVFLITFRRFGVPSTPGSCILSLFIGGFVGALAGDVTGFYFDLGINSSFYGNATVNFFIQPFGLMVQGFLTLVVGLAATSSVLLPSREN